MNKLILFLKGQGVPFLCALFLVASGLFSLWTAGSSPSNTPSGSVLPMVFMTVCGVFGVGISCWSAGRKGWLHKESDLT